MKVRFYHWYNAVLAALLCLLGFESCDDIGADEYGSPYVKYQVKGTVTDNEGRPIKGIKVKVAEQGMHNGSVIIYHGIDSIETDAAGAYQTHVMTDGFINERRKVIFEDTDGTANGGDFQGDTLSLTDLEKTLVEKGGEWYRGKYEMKGDVTLKAKTDN